MRGEAILAGGNPTTLAKGTVLGLPGLCDLIQTRETEKTLLEPRCGFASLRLGKASLPSLTALHLSRPHFEGMNR